MKIRATTILVTHNLNAPMAACRIETCYEGGSYSNGGLITMPLFDWINLLLILEMGRRSGLAHVEFEGDEILRKGILEACSKQA